MNKFQIGQIVKIETSDEFALNNVSNMYREKYLERAKKFNTRKEENRTIKSIEEYEEGKYIYNFNYGKSYNEKFIIGG